MYKPPLKVSPVEAFRLLLDVSPSVELEGLPNFPPLRAYALSSGQIATSLTSSDPTRALVAASLKVSPLALEGATAKELELLRVQVEQALSSFPCFGYSHYEEWIAYLRKGAKATWEAFVLGGCVENFRERPDQYWGIPFNQLLDCHWFAYRAAKAAIEKRT